MAAPCAPGETMKIRHVLETKTRQEVVTIQADRTMRQAVAQLVGNNIGALVVMSGDQPVGIVTERDVLRQVARHDGAFLDTPVSQIMTREIVVGTYDEDVGRATYTMTERRFRHLPILDGGKLVAIVSMGDIVRAQCTTAQTEVLYLRDYIAGSYR